MRFSRYVAVGFQVAILAFVFTQFASADLLHFNLTGKYDSPNGIYPLASPRFAVNFNLPSDPGNTISGFEVVELYTNAVYSNNGISTAPLASTYLLFDTVSNGGGMYVSLPASAQSPYGLSIDFGYGGLPQVYSNTAADPHFSPGVIDFGSARDRYADQGAGYPMTDISNAILTITPVPEPYSFFLLSVPALFFGWRICKKNQIEYRQLVTQWPAFPWDVERSSRAIATGQQHIRRGALPQARSVCLQGEAHR